MHKDLNNRKVDVGIIGCGDVSHLYIKQLFKNQIIRIAFCYDKDPEKSQAISERYGIPRLTDLSQVFQSGVKLIVTLTPPNTRELLIPDLLNAGFSVYTEKPIALNSETALRFMEIARKNNVHLNSAPDLYLSRWLNNAKELVKNGVVGNVLSIHCFLLSDGPESWHPEPSAFYQKGAGPIFDRAVYYVTAMLEIFGNISSVFAISSRLENSRLDHSRKTQFAVEVDTHFHCLLHFKGGFSASMIASFDIKTTQDDNGFIVYGSKNTMLIPNPMDYLGQVRIWSDNMKSWESIETNDAQGIETKGEMRGFGVIEMAENILSQKNSEKLDLSLKTLKVMESILKSAETNSIVKI